MRKGFTMLEVLTCLIIIATLAAILLPRFSATKNKINQRQAESFLRDIRKAEKMYYARNGQYVCTGCTNAAGIKSFLGIEIREGAYTFSVTTPTTSTFTAFTTRTSDSKTTNLNQDGTWGGTYAPLPAGPG